MADASSLFQALLQHAGAGSTSNRGNTQCSDATELAKWRKAAEQLDDGDAMSSLGVAYANGTHGLAKDLNEAFKWFDRAAEQSDMNGVINSCKVMLSGKMPASGSASRVFERVHTAAKVGVEQAIPLCAHCLREGIGCDKDEERAVALLRLGAAVGNAECMADLGVAAAHGRGCEMDKAAAFRWFEKAAEKGDLNGLRNCGLMLLGGIGCEENADRARVMLQRAEDAGDKHAGTLKQMATFGENAAGSGSGSGGDSGTSQIGELLMPTSKLRAAAEGGLASAMDVLGDRLMQGHGCGKDQKQAVKWYRRAAMGGDADAMTSLGVALVHGRGCDEDCIEAFQWFKRAAEEGHMSGLRNCGLMLRKGMGCHKDEAAGRKMLQRAADKGDAQAAEHLKGGDSDDGADAAHRLLALMAMARLAGLHD